MCDERKRALRKSSSRCPRLWCACPARDRLHHQYEWTLGRARAPPGDDVEITWAASSTNATIEVILMSENQYSTEPNALTLNAFTTISVAENPMIQMSAPRA